MARKIDCKIPDQYTGKKIFTFLKGEMKLSTRLIVSLKHEPDGILLNGEHARTIDIFRIGDTLTLNLPEKQVNVEASSVIMPEILYEDEDILVINKPSGLAMHPTHNHQGDTLANAVAAYLEKSGRPVSFHAVGRLDKCTSGVVIIALTGMAAAFLQGRTEKEYLAIAGGTFEGSGTIDRPIYRPDAMKTLRSTGETGDRAVTHYTSLGSGTGISLLRITLETGRTHQIRVHFSSLGAPLAGDEMYGSEDKRIGRAALHCERVTLIHPISHERLLFTAPLPADMTALLKEAEINYGGNNNEI